jgi:hypothetical protein
VDPSPSGVLTVPGGAALLACWRHSQPHAPTCTGHSVCEPPALSRAPLDIEQWVSGSNLHTVCCRRCCERRLLNAGCFDLALQGLLSLADVAGTFALILLHPHHQLALSVNISAALDMCG